jgi:predicted nucleic acid-binding protein
VNRIVVDTTVLIDASRGRADAMTYLATAVGSSELWSVTPVRTEVRWAMRREEHAGIDRMFRSIYWLEVSNELADRAGTFGQQFGSSHGLDVVDAIVAAATEFLEADLATLNVRDFPMFPGLQPPY